jgi:hypothetical protein
MFNFNNELISVYNSKLFNDICKKYGGRNHEELKSEVISILIELPIEKKKQIVENDYLLPYSIQITKFQISNKTWTAYRKKYLNRENLIYIDSFDDFNYPEEEYEFDILDELDPSIIHNKIQSDMLDQSNKYFYHSRLLNELIVSDLNTKRLSVEIGIPYTSVRHALKEYRQHLREWLK